MIRPHFYLLMAAGVLAASPLLAQHAAQSVLVMHGGQVIRGDIHRLGDGYQVRLANNDEIRLPVDRVQLVATDLEAAYRQLRDQLSPRDPAARLDLASWCLRWKLYARAADQLLAARQFQGESARLTHLERRLHFAVVEVDPLTLAETRTLDQGAPDLINSLPAAIVEEYTHAVQPLLLSRCGLAGCHGLGAKNEFQLLRPAANEFLSHRHTQRNLAATLTQVHRRDPTQSPLLLAAQKAHGGMGACFRTDEDPLFQRIQEWVMALASGSSLVRLAAIQEPETVLRQASFGEPVLSRHGELQAMDDPFDPDEFNQRYHGASEPAELADPAAGRVLPGLDDLPPDSPPTD
ncbi:hypothetical protein [Lignipirellula cremea]|uniref:SLA1 homology domain-containing protein n=1 Tax=Lignipirellula cremea TaxID=2528010 RepID=A0A518DYM6_9BACT|nr:hypothetical protein [Lignipirellula cremea]QDU96949.1 hypothetical protein Pla8534_47740 [Lignipirellula cremea]